MCVRKNCFRMCEEELCYGNYSYPVGLMLPSENWLIFGSPSGEMK